MEAVLHRDDGPGVHYLTPSASIDAGSVVIDGGVVGVAPYPIEKNTEGVIQTQGIFKVVKGSDAWTVGQKVYWNATAKTAAPRSDGGTNKFLGIADQAAASGDTTVFVRLTEPAGTNPSALALTAPTLTLTADSSSVTATWSAITGAASYTLAYSTDQSTWTEADNLTGTSKTVGSLSASTAYYFKIKAVGDGTEYSDSAYSAVSNKTTEAAASE